MLAVQRFRGFLTTAGLACFTFAAATTTAQVRPEESPFPRILIRRLDSIVAHPEAQRLTTARSGMELLAHSPLGEFGRLDDVRLMQFVDVFNTALGQVSPDLCADIWRTLGRPEYGKAYTAVAAAVDSTTAEAWTEFLAELAWIGLRGQTKGRQVTQAEAEPIMRQAHALIPPEELREIFRIQELKQPTAADDCFLMRSTFRSMLRLPPETVAPVFRGMIGR